MKVRHLIVACALVGSLAGGSLIAYAQVAPGQMAITASYIMTLNVERAMPIIMPEQANAGMMGEVLVNTGPTTTLPSTSDQGQPVNHFIGVQITRKSPRTITSDLAPQILVYNQGTGATQRYVMVQAMYPASDPLGVQYGVNVHMPDGLYTITVIVANEQASFSDLMITGGGTLSGASAAAPSASASVSPTRANDGRTLAGEPAATQALFRALWGSNAAAEWVREHNLALSGGR